MKLCNNDCVPLCDFCINFNEHKDLEFWHSDGICEITNKEVDRIDCCDDFHCFRYKEQKIDF